MMLTNPNQYASRGETLLLLFYLYRLLDETRIER